MPTEKLNDSEKYLLEKWGEARELEIAMDSVREKYKSMYQKAVDAIKRKHPDLDVAKVYVTQFWGPGYLGIGKSGWPTDDSDNPTGLWFENVRLEVLAEAESNLPHAYLWISEKTALQTGVDLEKTRIRVESEAAKLFSAVERNSISRENERGLFCAIPVSSKSELLRQFSKGEGSDYISTIVACADRFYPLFTIFDEVFKQAKMAPRK